jgi:hypothetical protein
MQKCVVISARYGEHALHRRAKGFSKGIESGSKERVVALSMKDYSIVATVECRLCFVLTLLCSTARI